MRKIVQYAGAAGALAIVGGFIFSHSSTKNILVKVYAKSEDPQTCLLLVDVANGTDNHLTGATINFAGSSVQIPSVAAKSGVSGVRWTAFRIPRDFDSCEEAAKKIGDKTGDFSVSECTMAGVAEGDCQGMIRFESDSSLDGLRQEEKTQIQEAASANLAPGSYSVVGLSDSSVGMRTTGLSVYEGGPNPPPNRFGSFFPLQLIGSSIVKISDVHKNSQGIADWYKVTVQRSYDLQSGLPRHDDVSGWSSASDLEALIGPHAATANR